MAPFAFFVRATASLLERVRIFPIVRPFHRTMSIAMRVLGVVTVADLLQKLFPLSEELV